jgi:hypothetical protein
MDKRKRQKNKQRSTFRFRKIKKKKWNAQCLKEYEKCEVPRFGWLNSRAL